MGRTNKDKKSLLINSISQAYNNFVQVFFIVLIFCLAVHAQPMKKDFPPDTLVERQVKGNMFLFAGLGSSEILYLGLGYNFNNKYRAALTPQIFPAQANTEGGLGIKPLAGLGLRFSMLFCEELLKRSWFPLDNLSFEYCYGFNTKNESNVNKFQLTVGSDKIRKSRINFLWAIGLATVAQKNKTPLLIPSIKIGLINNF
ncbi:MAG: hypothetical protein WC209_12340 [Ignavibacteriaceae bacterium]|jgi:hypothetical protein